jgi:DNA-binding NtrC family response regulator
VPAASGTGKEVVARLIHRLSPRAGHPFVVVNCPALPANLQEAELFGVERRVATEVDSRTGLLEAAEGGTVLLDEIGDLEHSAQAKILRFTQDKTVERVGGRKVLELDLRILAATNHDLHRLIAEEKFRADLYHRLNTFTITIPPLRERREDIVPLVAHFLARSQAPHLTVSAEALDILVRHEFPGNVRELERIVERATIMAEGPVIGPADLPALDAAHESSPAQGGDTSESLADELYDRVVRRGQSFWTAVHRPYMDRSLQAGAVRGLIRRARDEAGGSYRNMARLFGIETFQGYKKLTAFLRNHGLLPRQGRGESPADGEGP